MMVSNSHSREKSGMFRKNPVWFQPESLPGRVGPYRNHPGSAVAHMVEGPNMVEGPKKKRKWNGRIEFMLIKRWVTGEKADMDSEDIEREFFSLAPLHVIGCLSPDVSVQA